MERLERMDSEVAVPGGSAPGVRYAAVRVKSLLRQHAQENGSWHWRLDPYEGCQFGCLACPVRLGEHQDAARWRELESRVAVKVNAAQVLRAELRHEDFRGHPIWIGEQTEAWQHVEEQVRLTRALLGLLAQEEGREVRISTRSSLIARDGDILREIARRNHLTVAFSLPSLDEKVNRLVEPRAPSAFRRLAAMEALARLGVEVGLMVAPVFPGLDDDELQLKAMLSRASNAGARFAGIRFFAPSQPVRDHFLRRVTEAYPEAATRVRRVLGRRTPQLEELRSLEKGFELLCRSLGLQLAEQALAPRARKPQPATQLALFG
ncbi:MAG TPA: radical SAM protein [Myxococcaceae bacterium]